MFEMVHLKHIPIQLGHLAGLLDLFKGKMVGNIILYTHWCEHLTSLVGSTSSQFN